FSSRRRHTRFSRDWSSDVCSSDLTPTDYPISDSIKNRWSPRIFANTPITEQQVKILLEAGRWAPSASNIQPWRVIWGLKGTEMRSEERRVGKECRSRRSP